MRAGNFTRRDCTDVYGDSPPQTEPLRFTVCSFGCLTYGTTVDDESAARRPIDLAAGRARVTDDLAGTRSANSLDALTRP